jgi:ABC-type oligopeptide transport system substrate-binding subunit
MTVDTTRTNITVTEETNDVIVKRDYDLAGCFGLQITPDDNAVAFLEQNLRSTSPSNRTGYASPAMDAALTELKRASTEQAKIAGFKKIADLWNEGMPQLPLFHTEESVFWSAKVHGIRSTGLYAALLDKAWME